MQRHDQPTLINSHKTLSQGMRNDVPRCYSFPDLDLAKIVIAPMIALVKDILQLALCELLRNPSGTDSAG